MPRSMAAADGEPAIFYSDILALTRRTTSSRDRMMFVAAAMALMA